MRQHKGKEISNRRIVWAKTYGYKLISGFTEGDTDPEVLKDPSSEIQLNSSGAHRISQMSKGFGECRQLGHLNS